MIGSSVSGDSDIDLTGGKGSISWSGTVAAKPSSVCHLTAIRCANATLSPAFNKDTTYYTTNVPYSVSKLSLDYDRADKSSTVSISGTELAVGANTITIKVTAADGTTKTYTISATRQQDPNYKAGTDASLKELKLDAAAISPAFSAECADYVAYVPFETKEVTLSGAANDEKAVTSGEKTVKLTEVGVTDASVICTAEDGKTTKTYTVHVYRMPAYTGIIPLIEERTSTETDIATETQVEEQTPTLDIPAKIKLPLLGSASTLLVAGITAVIVLALLFALGFLTGRGQAEKFADDDFAGDECRSLWPEATAPEKREEEEAWQSAAQSAASELETIEEPQQDSEELSAEEEKETIPEPDDDIRAAEKAAESMSLDDLLKDIRDM